MQMKAEKKKESYLDSFKDYQDKIYSPGHYVGGKIHPALKAKTKAGGYFRVLEEYSFWCFMQFSLVIIISTKV